jgi:hypothetical protein
MVLQSYISVPQYTTDGTLYYMKLSLDSFTNILPKALSPVLQISDDLDTLTLK